MIYIHNYPYLILSSNIELGEKKVIWHFLHSAYSNNSSFPQLHILTLKNTNTASKAVNQRKSPQLKIPNNR